MPYKYSTEIKENNAKASGISLPISTKHSIEICSFIRGKTVERAKTILEGVIKKKEAVPFRRFTESVGHRRGGMSSGRYPVKASAEILKVVKSAESNAQFRGLSAGDLIVRHISAQRAAGSLHYGRQRGRQQKRTTIEVVVEEKRMKEEKGKAEEKPKQEAKKEKKAPVKEGKKKEPEKESPKEPQKAEEKKE
jgi:large subunit ribosomal protein L22